MLEVAVLGIGQLPVRKRYDEDLRALGARAVELALAAAGLAPDEGRVGALYAGNMLSDELQGQKHLASLIADEAGLRGVEALAARAATATGAAALRLAYLAVASGAVDIAVAVGVEKMSTSPPVHVLAKALDARLEVPDGATLISQNARLMQRYLDTYHAPADALAAFSVNAHDNATHNPIAMFGDRPVTAADVMASRLIYPPIRLLDCSPISDGAAAVVLGRAELAGADQPVRLRASAAATDRFRLADRPAPLRLVAAQLSFERALAAAGLNRAAIDFFEVHDAFTIMACLILEATGFAEPGEGWRLAADGDIRLTGRLPICTLGGLKARGHPIGATALYQACEIVLQLTGGAGANQVANARVGLMQSVGGAAATVLTHLFSRAD